MRTFGTIKSKDHTIEKFYASSQIDWRLVSSSDGVIVENYPDFFEAVTITHAINDPLSEEVNLITDTNKYVQYRSVKHLFYTNMVFSDGTTTSTASLASLQDNNYVISIGQQFYGDRIKPGSFELAIDSISEKVLDDEYGNLYVSQSGTGSYVGNVFYNQGIAVITEDSSSIASTVALQGIKIISGSNIYVNYDSDVKVTRHQINVKLEASDFNFSIFNPSVHKTFTATGSVTQSFDAANLPILGNDTWKLTDLMGANIIKPYVTTIGLYNDRYELVAVAKLSTPIQRTFDMEQMFIVRFDAE
jgi:hypothetical protein